jgi:hypothetical protein
MEKTSLIHNLFHDVFKRPILAYRLWYCYSSSFHIILLLNKGMTIFILSFSIDINSVILNDGL